MSVELVLALSALVLAAAAVIVAAVVLRRQRSTRTDQADTQTPGPPSGPVAIIVNPSKVTNLESLRTHARTVAHDLGLAEPLWYETTIADPGSGQAQAALAAGASTVVAAGGDGTVRAVARTLAGTGVPMGLLPLGTGNLLARNLDLPSEFATRALLTTAFTGPTHPIDVGWIRAERPDDVDDDAEEHLFLVIAGIGFDVAMVASADEQLKAKMGWMAYFVAGVQHLHGRKTRLRLSVDGGASIPLRLRSLLVANCGRLPGGIVLLPDAEIDDGWFDIAAIDTRGGVLGWAALLGKVIRQGLGIRRDLPGEPGSIEFWRGHTVTVQCEHPEVVQVDGDLLGEVTALHLRMEPGDLLVRTRSGSAQSGWTPARRLSTQSRPRRKSSSVNPDRTDEPGPSTRG